MGGKFKFLKGSVHLYFLMVEVALLIGIGYLVV